MKYSILLFAVFLAYCRPDSLLVDKSENGKDGSGVHTLSVTPKIAVGAIRWDAWIGDAGNSMLVGSPDVGLQVERALSPNQYHYRAPFFSVEINADSIQCRGLTQTIMDQEIAYAKDAGIDYWAFCWYPWGSGLDSARTLYLQSTHATDVKWCVILGTGTFSQTNDAPWLVDRFEEDNYQKVDSGRPLIYIYQTLNLAILTKIRQLCTQRGIPAPYVAVMGTTASNAYTAATSLSADALSSYKSTVGSNGQAYYPVIPKGDSTGWENYKLQGMPLIPWVTTGRNLKPRIDNPVSWQTVPASQWVADGTPGQIANNLLNSLNWTRANPTTCPAETIIMYAWNEFDEGGWICPTFGNNTTRLDSIKNVLSTNN